MRPNWIGRTSRPRLEHNAESSGLDFARIVLIDETDDPRIWQGATGARHGASATSAKVETRNFIAGLSHDLITAPLLLDGPMTGWPAGHRSVGCSLQRPRAVVLLSRGAGLADVLPPKSRHRNPIEGAFSKLKTMLHKDARSPSNASERPSLLL
jgi:hypothetical protein